MTLFDTSTAMYDPARDDRCRILGIPISVVTMDSAISRIEHLARQTDGSYVCVTDVYNIVLAQSDAEHKRVLMGASMITPDGTPISWLARLRGQNGIDRVCGPDLMPRVIEASQQSGLRHYFLGGAEGVPERLSQAMQNAYPKAQIVGTFSPPFRTLSDGEKDAMLRDILTSGANVLWIGLGCPKQEKWMADHRAALPGVVQIGVGAAFNFHTGEVARAPLWMRRNGLEWLHRLASEPRRLWQRYFIMAPRFVWGGIIETLTGTYREPIDADIREREQSFSQQ